MESMDSGNLTISLLARQAFNQLRHRVFRQMVKELTDSVDSLFTSGSPLPQRLCRLPPLKRFIDEV